MSLVKSKYIRSFIKKYWLNYLVGIVFLIVIDFFQTRIPDYIGIIIDMLDRGEVSNLSDITHYIVLILISAFVIVLGRMVWRYFLFGTSRKIERDIRNDLFAHLEGLSQNYYHQNKTGEIMAYITNDLEAVRQAMGQGVMMIFDTACLLVFILSSMFVSVSATLTIVSVIPLAIIAAITGLLGPKLFKRFYARQAAFSKISDFVQEDLSGMKVIKAFVQQDKEVEAFEKVNKKYYEANMSLTRTRAIMDPLMTLITGLSFAVAIGFGGYLALKSNISVGSFSEFISYLGMLVWPMMAVGMSINMITMGSAGLKRIEDVLNVEYEIKDSPDAVVLENFTGSVEVNNLTFSYNEDNSPVLTDVSFKLEEGQTLGIVGRTGSGKTTLMNLITRLFNTQRGMISVSGVDINDLTLAQLRGNIGYVTQDNFLFSDTIRNNVDFVDGTKSMEEVVDATNFSCVHDNIEEFAEGYDTIIGEKGVTLSGGQKQRVSISRAYIIKPKILILDDSLSAVDTDTEERILHNIRRERKGKTNIIIAHRLSAIQDADKIIVLDEGRVVESGSHSQLLKGNGLYRSLYEKQQLEKMINEEGGQDDE